MPSLETSLYGVSLLNDDKTPMEFVVGTKPVKIQALSSYAAAARCVARREITIRTMTG